MKSKSNSVTPSHWTCFTKWLKSEHEKSVKNRNVLIFHFEITCLKIIFSFVFEFSLFHSDLEYKVQRPLGYQGNTDQAHSWSVQNCCLFFPCCTSLFPNPFDLSLAGPCGLILLPTRACFSPWFLIESTDSTSFYNHKESGWIFFCVIRNVLLPVRFESCRRLVPRWILTSPECVCCWQGSHSFSLPWLLPLACLDPADLKQHLRFRSCASDAQIICWTEVQIKGCMRQLSLRLGSWAGIVESVMSGHWSGAEAEEGDLGKAFLPLSSTQRFQLFSNVGPLFSSQNILKWKSRNLLI